MIEILPNWHPIFVHFTIGLLSMAVVFYLIQAALPEEHRWQAALTTLAKTNLWVGTGFAIITAIAGWYAYNSVNHDTPSHAAMTDHRNWALVTLATFVVLTLWSTLFRSQKKAPIFFVIIALIAGGLLASTGWRGAEAVYRYGLGVMSLPKSSGEGHAHKHAKGEEHGDTATMQKPKEEGSSHPHAKGEEHDATTTMSSPSQSSSDQSTSDQSSSQQEMPATPEENTPSVTDETTNGDNVTPEPEATNEESASPVAEAIVEEKTASDSSKASHTHDSNAHKH